MGMLKALGCWYNCRQVTYGSFQLMHMSCGDQAVQMQLIKRAMAAKPKTKHYYSAHNIATRMSFGT